LLEKRAEDQRNLLLLLKVPPDNGASYWAGFCWDRAGAFTNFDAWKAYIEHFAAGLHSPIEVTIAGP